MYKIIKFCQLFGIEVVMYTPGTTSSIVILTFNHKDKHFAIALDDEMITKLNDQEVYESKIFNTVISELELDGKLWREVMYHDYISCNTRFS